MHEKLCFWQHFFCSLLGYIALFIFKLYLPLNPTPWSSSFFNSTAVSPFSGALVTNHWLNVTSGNPSPVRATSKDFFFSVSQLEVILENNASHASVSTWSVPIIFETAGLQDHNVSLLSSKADRLVCVSTCVCVCVFDFTTAYKCRCTRKGPKIRYKDVQKLEIKPKHPFCHEKMIL